MGKHGPVKKHIWNFVLMGYLTGWSGEKRLNAQVNRLATHTHTQTHKYTILVPIVVPLRVSVYLALRSMGPSTDR